MFLELYASFMMYYNEPIEVAVLDTGLNNHYGHIPTCDNSYSFTSHQYKIGEDKLNHGTAVSSVLHQYVTGNVIGNVSNLNWEAVAANKISESPNYCQSIKKINFNSVEAGLNSFNQAYVQIKASKTRYVNISSSGFATNSAEKKHLKDLLDLGVTIVVAAGNEGSDIDVYKVFPASYDERIIVVGTYERNLSLNNFYKNSEIAKTRYSKHSNYGKVVDVWGPGESVYAHKNTGILDVFTGTSFAAPAYTGKLIKEEIERKERWKLKLLNKNLREL